MAIIINDKQCGCFNMTRLSHLEWPKSYPRNQPKKILSHKKFVSHENFLTYTDSSATDWWSSQSSSGASHLAQSMTQVWIDLIRLKKSIGMYHIDIRSTAHIPSRILTMSPYALVPLTEKSTLYMIRANALFPSQHCILHYIQQSKLKFGHSKVSGKNPSLLVES